ncbi:phosphate transport system substrate-binding protein [Nocardioides zeae]|uniref:Phosphate transport system substrate-binding protein n=2 Tax=Nocardioides zeae TaxID=1457234 RepID=A0ACC6ID51_9ACTN|nr:phosphate ABC transporter substrate-binding protein PstS [Nocardioides zeae]MDQ1104566.1 phosphate transport system substrate-binding protein [Nocardioides zeae]MDR6175741.1 phosphate transport system substrate-binding protein [Nocardioides zeae]MDR6208670.1 phosphate transport system substrate-binding protein [Nocardioides zeae]
MRLPAPPRPRVLRYAALVATLLLLLGTTSGNAAAARAVVYAQIEGTGSTWSQLIVEQWIADVEATGMRVAYTGGGSSLGRKNFAQGSTDFAISEIPYQGVDEFGNADTAGNRQFAYLPIVAGGTAFTYQLKVGNQQVRNLRLSGATIAKIFTNQITSWDDPAITADNNGRTFPKIPITPVVRADGSGTTAQFTAWLAARHGSTWKSLFPRGTLTSYFPREGRAIAQAGSDQVMNTVASSSGNGTIGYVEYSYPVNEDYPVVKVLNEGGYYVEPTQYNVAVALTQARIKTEDPSASDYLTQDLRGVYSSTDPRAYPLSSYSYMIIPVGAQDRRMTTAKRQTLVDFMYYSLCQGQTKAGPYGYSPLPLNLVQAGFTQLARLGTADGGVELANRDVRSCNNPTFNGRNLNENRLATIAPAPAACDKQGAGPCGTDTGTGEPSTDDPAAGGGGGGGGGTGTAAGPAGAGTGAAPVGSDVQLDPTTGQPVAAAATGGGAVFASPLELTSDRPGDRGPFAWLVAAEVLALVFLPAMITVWLRRRPGASR